VAPAGETDMIPTYDSDRELSLAGGEKVTLGELVFRSSGAASKRVGSSEVLKAAGPAVSWVF